MDDFDIQRDEVFQEDTVEFWVLVANRGRQTLYNVPFEIQDDGRRVASGVIPRILPGARGYVRGQFQANRGGVRNICAVVDPHRQLRDFYREDNTLCRPLSVLRWVELSPDFFEGTTGQFLDLDETELIIDSGVDASSIYIPDNLTNNPLLETFTVQAVPYVTAGISCIIFPGEIRTSAVRFVFEGPELLITMDFETDGPEFTGGCSLVGVPVNIAGQLDNIQAIVRFRFAAEGGNLVSSLEAFDFNAEVNRVEIVGGPALPGWMLNALAGAASESGENFNTQLSNTISEQGLDSFENADLGGQLATSMLQLPLIAAMTTIMEVTEGPNGGILIIGQ